MTTALTTASPIAARPRVPAYQVVLGVLVIALPAVSALAVADSSALTTPMQLFTMMLSGFLPLLFGVVVVCFGCLTLTWRINHGFVALTAVRGSIRADLARRALVNAVVVGAVFFLAVAVAAVVAFEVVPRADLVTFRPESMLNYPDGSAFSPAQVRAGDLANNTWSFLYAAGWPVYAFVYAGFVGISAALWATAGFAAVLLVPNRYLALALPFLAINLIDFPVQVAGMAQLSPLISVFPFNITAQPLWTTFVPFTVLALVVVGLSGYCWRHGDHLESLS